MERARRRREVVDYAAVEAGIGAGGAVYEDATRFHAVLNAKRPRFARWEDHVTQCTGSELTLDWLRRHGLRQPILVRDRAGLGLSIPGPGFTVRDVAEVVGEDVVVEVMDVASQTEVVGGWKLKQWADYFHNPAHRRAVLNVISLEFSGTGLEPLVRAPRVVRQCDWIDTVWPGARHAAGQYPRVQNYCLMSVGGAWTDFHIDFGGTSVWYHVHTGSKTFLFVPPTPAALTAYEQWTTSPGQSATFFGDLVDTCFEVTLTAGNTLFIPTGWIHAVFTPTDSLVFGGNFMHGFDMPGQLRIYELETFTRVPRKYRFPYYEHQQWYAAAYYLQFTRLPQFAKVLRAALALMHAPAQQAGAPEEEAAAAQREALSQQLFQMGLGWHECTGLPALIKTLAHIQAGRAGEGAATASAAAGTVVAAAPTGGMAPAGPRLKLTLRRGSGHATTDSVGGGAGTPSATAVTPTTASQPASAPAPAPAPAPASVAGGPVSLKLRFGVKKGGATGAGGQPGVREEGTAMAPHMTSAAATQPSVAAAPSTTAMGAAVLGVAATTSRTPWPGAGIRVKGHHHSAMATHPGLAGGGGQRRRLVDGGDAMVSVSLDDDESTTFPAWQAAQEACIMGGCGDARALLEELACRVDVEAADYDTIVATRFPTPTPPSLLRQHVRDGVGNGEVEAPYACVMHPPKQEVHSLPVATQPGGFGLYGGGAPAWCSEEDGVSAEGKGYTYGDVAGHIGDITIPLSHALAQVEDGVDGRGGTGKGAGRGGEGGAGRRGKAGRHGSDDSDEDYGGEEEGEEDGDSEVDAADLAAEVDDLMDEEGAGDDDDDDGGGIAFRVGDYDSDDWTTASEQEGQGAPMGQEDESQLPVVGAKRPRQRRTRRTADGKLLRRRRRGDKLGGEGEHGRPKRRRLRLDGSEMGITVVHTPSAHDHAMGTGPGVRVALGDVGKLKVRAGGGSHAAGEDGQGRYATAPPDGEEGGMDDEDDAVLDSTTVGLDDLLAGGSIASARAKAVTTSTAPPHTLKLRLSGGACTAAQETSQQARDGGGITISLPLQAWQDAGAVTGGGGEDDNDDWLAAVEASDASMPLPTGAPYRELIRALEPGADGPVTHRESGSSSSSHAPTGLTGAALLRAKLRAAKRRS